MHILVTNDDGPPSSKSSPYVHAFINHLKAAGHQVSVCLPDTQRSWIGKAHMIGQTLKPTYFRPSTNVHGDDTEGTTNARPDQSGAGDEEWILVDGTPASCVQIGLNHFFGDKGPVDLVVSGPNYGRNTTAIFALSSGTLGAALEAAACKVRSIAVSFAFFSRNHDPVIIEAACRQSIKVIDGLCKQWPTDGSVDLYSVNVPLVESVDTRKTYLTKMLQNYWQAGGCFEEIDDPSTVDPQEEEARIRQDGEAKAPEGGEKACAGHKHKHFKWAPRFTDVYTSVEQAGPGSDGWVVKEGHTSVTPLKANFAQADIGNGQQELNFSAPAVQEENMTLAMREKLQDSSSNSICDKIQAFVAYEDEYVQPLIVSAIKSILPDDVVDLITAVTTAEDGTFSASRTLSSPDARALQIMPYESLDFDYTTSNTRSYMINSYMIRKALIRKHYLSTTVEHWIAKKPDSVLKTHMKRSEAFEVDYAEFLDDALIEAFDLRESLDRNDALGEDAAPEEKEWWILKPGMSDRGQGIRLFSTMDELQAIFDGWEEDQPDTDDEGEEGPAAQEGQTQRGGEDDGRDGITASHLRHFVAQPYIHPPLLVSDGGHKFHIRTYVLCAGSMQVYVYRHMLALFAAKPYTAPWEAPDDIERFLTNTCLQDSPNDTTVQRFWALAGLPDARKQDVFDQICAVTGDVFEGAARAMPIHFQTLPNAFEVFGLDFLVDDAGTAWLLEVNAFPDFKQTGGDLTEIVAGFWKGVVREAVVPFFGVDEGRLLDQSEEERKDMVRVRDVDLGRR
ncbi:hypothetical protein PWT90_05060 [Aphanocladium album]|nr:hypothetical protein PWT90_05060 [Aphanocladium album]